MEWINHELLANDFLGNSAEKWLVFLLVTLAAVVGLRLGLYVLTRQVGRFSKRTKLNWDDALNDALHGTRLGFLTAVAFYLGSQSLKFSHKTEKLISTLLFLAIFIQGCIWGQRFINSWIRGYVDKSVSGDGSKLTTVNAIAFIVKMVFFITLTLWTLDNFGINITTLVTGLGIGGIAVALAVQNILGDLFASLTIVLDKPFVIGDSIVAGDVSGTIEYIGLKTTRIRGASGEQIILPNSNLLQSRIHNMKRMQERSVTFRFGVAYETEPQLLKEIPTLAKQIIEVRGNTRFTRTHFVSFGESQLTYETLYTILSADYSTYLDIQQDINLELMKAFSARKIEFAYPTRTVYTKPL